MEVGGNAEKLLLEKGKDSFPEKLKPCLIKYLCEFACKQFGPKPSHTEKEVLAGATARLFPALNFTQSELNGIVC